MANGVHRVNCSYIATKFLKSNNFQESYRDPDAAVNEN